jgi:hypothetical protein
MHEKRVRIWRLHRGYVIVARAAEDVVRRVHNGVPCEDRIASREVLAVLPLNAVA